MAITNNLGQTKVGVRTVVQAQQSSFLLDTYSGAAAAYSLRKLSSTYTGSAIRVRRSSDNTEMNIGFDASGNLDTATLTTFVGSGNGFVTTWYDQSGNGKDVSQSTSTSQPKIVNSGSVMTKNGKPCIDFTSGQYLKLESRIIGITENSVFNVFSIKNLSSRGVAWDIGNTAGYQFYAFDINTYGTVGNRFGFYSSVAAFDSNIPTNLNQNLITVISNNSYNSGVISNTNYYINNIQASLTSPSGGSGAVYPNFSSASRITIGDFQNFPTPFSGTHQEFISYPINQSVNRLAISNNISSYYSIFPTVSDTDAQAFVNAAGLTSSVQANAINTLVTSLKTAGIWTKMKALYPFVGGSDSSHKFNLKDPRDLDAAYRLQFNGGWTHTSTGAKPNGTNAYADTKLVASILTYPFLGYYSRSNTNTNTDQIDMGSSDMNKWTWVSAWYKAGIYNNILARNSNSLILLDGGIQTDSRGWYWTNKVNTTAKLGKNGNILTSATDSTNPGSINIAIGAMGSPSGANYYSNREVGFSVIADNLNDTDTQNLYTAVQAFQTTLGRAV